MTPTTVPEYMAEVFDTWLHNEIVESNSNRNSYMNNFATHKSGYLQRFDAQGNMNAAKLRAHYDRLVTFTTTFAEEPTTAISLERQLFCILMKVSGLYRHQCYITAITGKQYEELRHQDKAVGIDIIQAIRRGLADNTTDKNTIVRDTLHLNNAEFEAMQSLHDSQPPRGEKLKVLKHYQSAWISLGARYVHYGAAVLGGIANVQLLEAKSLTDVTSHYYPFKD